MERGIVDAMFVRHPTTRTSSGQGQRGHSSILPTNERIHVSTFHARERRTSQRHPVRVQSFIPPYIEPENALSLPTWAVHTSSVFEWGLAMRLMWKYGEVSDNPRWKGMAWGMLPCLGSAMCACTWHFFYNATELEFLVALQAFLTIVGNVTCWIAAYRIYRFSSSSNDDGGDDSSIMLKPADE